MTQNKARILIVDDEKMNLKALADLLKDTYTVMLAKSGEQALNLAIDPPQPDLILLDVVMPEMDGYEVIKQLKQDERTNQIPVIFVTTLGSSEDEELGLKLGAVDYITKPVSPPIVRMRIHNYLNLMHKHKLLDQLAHLDGLTEIPNRRCFEEHFHKECSRIARNEGVLSIAMLDIDFFKQYNDYYGHQMGDRALETVAKTMIQSLKRPADLGARYGGEEFVMLLPETNAEGALDVAERVRAAIAALKIPHVTSQVADNITVSIGVTSVQGNCGCSLEKVLEIADHNLYRAKHSGRNRVVGDS
ncbi:MAG: diguanylate cyclase [Desulfohalobiaceae bacterium]|nr:diguanylate cyclase [Desulfohalobiaceae bacterium]